MTGKTVQRTIILVSANQKTIKKIYQNNPEYRTYSWLYLSKDALLFIKLRTVLPEDITILDTGDVLQNTAHRHRQDYIDFIGSLSVRNNSLYWWLTSVSEKNPFISTVFHYFCYLKIIEQFLNSSSNLVIICDSYSFIDTVKSTFGNRSDLNIRVVDSRIDRITSTTLRLFSGFVKKGYFAIRFISRIGIAKCFKIVKGHQNPGNNPNKMAIHSWTDARSFSSDGKYRDTYFGDMSVSIKEYRPDFYTISYVLPTIYYLKAVVNIARFDERIFLFEEFLSIGDVFRSLFSIIVKIPSNIDVPSLNNIDLSTIIRQEIHFDRYESSRSETALLHYYAGRRIANRGDLKTLIYTFENHMWEKMLCSGIRQPDNKCQLIGYAHSVISPMYLFYSLAESERTIVPLPDVILVNGQLSKERLTNAGFDKGKIVVCGAYRYGSMKHATDYHDKARDRKSILVITTSGFDETIELIDKVISAFRDTKGVTVIIKPHPTVTAEKIIQNFPKIPPQFSFSLEPVEKLLNTADLVIFTESAVSIEALARHIPVLHIKSDLRIDMNIFEYIKPIQSVAKPDEIERISLDLLIDSGIFNDRYDDIVMAFFAPVENKIIQQLIHPCYDEH